MTEPFVTELSKEFDRYMSKIKTLERKSQNLISIAGTFITILIGIIFIRITDYQYTLILILFIIGVLFAVIVICRLALRVRGQRMPIPISGFFIKRGISDSPFDIDTKLIDKTMINTKPICGMNESEKKEQTIKSEAREINMQRWLIGKYLKALLNAKQNGNRMAKYIRIAEWLFLISIGLGIIVSITSYIVYPNIPPILPLNSTLS